MPKNILEDIVRTKPRDKSMVDQGVERLYFKSKPEPSEDMIDDDYHDNHDKDKGNSSRGLWVVAFLSIIILFFALSFLFSKAKIIVNPKTESLALSENLSALKNGGPDNLSFNLMAIPGEETRTVVGGEKKEVSQKATGSIVIYNTFSSIPQSLSVDTRLEGSNGKIYKTQTKTTVPGMAKDGIPGSVEVKIYGAEAGAEYNSSPLDFKIFGFKGTPKYSKFYARSKGPITGGLKGFMSTISDTDEAKPLEDIRGTLKTKLLKKAIDQIPSGFVLFKDAVFLSIDSETVTPASSDGQIPITIKGTLFGFLLKEDEITKKIVETLIPNYDGSSVHISNIRDLAFSIANKESISFKDVQNIDFKLSGTPKIVWDVDTKKLSADVLGKKKKEFKQILLQYPNINSADLIIRPIWKMSFPQKAKSIEVIVNSPI